MYFIKAIVKLKFLIIPLLVQEIQCSIQGYSIMKPFRRKSGNEIDPCNPLYWYPKTIPEYCYLRTTPSPDSMLPNPPIPVPIPVPIPLPPPPMPIPPMIMPPPPPPPMMPQPIFPPGPPPPLYVPRPIYPLPMPLPFGIPLAPTGPMAPVPGIPIRPPRPYPMPFMPQYPPYPQPYPPPYPYPPYPRPRGSIGMVPGIPGIVSPGGGINIMPFADVYADLLERHKQKMIRLEFERLIKKYGGKIPYKNHNRKKKNDANTNDVNTNDVNTNDDDDSEKESDKLDKGIQ